MTDPHPWLARVHVEGFKTLRSVDFEPGSLTLLIGPNGAGKSNLLQALRLAPMLRTRSLGLFMQEAGSAAMLLHYGPKVTPVLALELHFDEAAGTSRYSVKLGYSSDGGGRLLFLYEGCGFKSASRGKFKERSLGAGHAESRLQESASMAIVREVDRCIAYMNFFHFHDTSAQAPLRGTSRVEDARYLRSNGSNLAAYLYALQRSENSDDRAAFARIEALFRRIAPFVKRLVPTPVGAHGSPVVADVVRENTGGHALWVRLDWVDERDEIFSSAYFSDGTLRFLALLTALHQPSHRLPKFICIDEPELGLHPAALHLLIESIRSISDRAQVLLATQSSALLDLFEPEEVVVVERRDGASVFRRLESAALEHWREDYSLSELFDKNVLGGRP